MTHAPTLNGHSSRRHTIAFTAAADPGLFDRPDRAIAAMRAIVYDITGTPGSISTQLDRRLSTDANARFWTESDMREYAALVNEVLDRLGSRLAAAPHAPTRVGVKASNRPSGRYAIFRFRCPDEEWCSRTFPAGLSLTQGPA